MAALSAIAFWGMTWGQVAMLTFSVVVSQIQASKAREAQRKAAAAADAAKGFQIVKEGEPSAIPVIYGRAVVAGVRVYHNTFNNYTYTGVGAGGTVFNADYSKARLLAADERRVFMALPAALTPSFGTPNTNAVYDGDTATILTPATTGVTLAGSVTAGSSSVPSGAYFSVSTSTMSGGDAGGDWSSTVTTGTGTWSQTAPAKSGDQVLYQVIGTFAAGNVTWGTPTAVGSTSPAEGDAATAALSTYSTGEIQKSGTGEKHEYLITQQVLCVGGIEACYEVDIDGGRIGGEYIDAVTKEIVYPFDTHNQAWVDAEIKANRLTFQNPYKGSALAYVYMSGGAADPLLTANDANRSTAVFTDCAYATTAYKLNRDEPQYQGIPSATFYVEGLKIYSIVRSGSVGSYTYALSGAKAYSNNPALCLLDYLLNTDYGLAVPPSGIDLESFYNSSVICDIDVTDEFATALTYEGALLRGKAKRYSLSNDARELKLYECNTVLDTSKPLRENVEVLLATMNDVDLVWSGGTYKLALKYPRLYVAGTGYMIDEMVQYEVGTDPIGLYRSKSGTIGTPNATAPYSAGVVNTAYWEDLIAADITDDSIVRDGETTVSWPNAQSRFNFATVRFLNEAKDFKEDTVSWPPKSAATAFVDRGAWNSATHYSFGDRVTYSATNYYCLQDGTFGAPPVVGGLWSLSYSNVYSTYLAQDSNLPLETDVFLAGVTSYYLAKAKAEQMVRTSRNAVTYVLNVERNNIRVEPGDIIRITSEVMQIPGDIARVTEVTPGANGVIKLTALRFDARNLAWNVADNEIIPERKIFGDDIGQASVLTFTKSGAKRGYVGVLSWVASNDSRVTSYQIKYAKAGTVSAGTAWTDIATVGPEITSFDISQFANGTFNLTVVARVANKQAPKEGWPTILAMMDPTQVDLASIVFTESADSTSPTAGVLEWDNPGDSRIGEYAIYHYSDVGGTFTWQYLLSVKRTFGQPTTAYTVPHLPEGAYIISIVAITDGVESEKAGWPRFNLVIGAVPQVSQPSITFTPTDPNQYLSGGSLTWTNPTSLRVVGFHIYITRDTTIDAATVWEDAGYVSRTPNSLTTTLSVPALIAGEWRVAVVSATATKQAPRLAGSTVVWPYIVINTIAADGVNAVELYATAAAFVTLRNTTTQTPATITFTALAVSFASPTYVWKVNDVVQAGETLSTFVLASFTPAAALSKQVKVEVQEGGSGAVSYDQMSVYSLQEGSDTVAVGLENENQTISCDAAGTIIAPTTVSSKMLVFKGINDISAACDFTLPTLGECTGLSALTGITFGLHTGLISVPTALMNAATAIIPFKATATNGTDFIGTLVKQLTLNKSNAGIDGTSAVTVRVSTPNQVFSRADATVTAYTPTTLVLTSTVYGGSPSAYLWEYWTGAAWTPAPNTNTAATYTVTATDFADSRTYRVSATVDAVAYYDELTIPHITGGTNAITVTQSNQAHPIPTASDGSAGDYTNSGNIIRVWEGATELQFTTGTSTAGQYKISVTPTNITAGSVSVAGATASYANASNITADAAFLSYAIEIKRTSGTVVNITCVQSFTRAKAGATGGTGGTGATGTRGSRQLYANNAAYTAAYNNGSGAGAPSYASQSTTLIAAAVAGSTPTTPINGDAVTFTNGTSYTYTNVYNGSAWVPPGTVIDGSLLVTGSITSTALSATAIDGKTITGATIQTAASGARTMVDATGLRVYDASSVLTCAVLQGNPTALVDLAGNNSIYGIRMNGSWSTGGLTMVNNSATGNGINITLASASAGIAASNTGTGPAGYFNDGIDSAVRLGDNTYAVNIVTGAFRYGSVTMSAFPGTLTSILRGDGTWGNPTSLNFGAGTAAKISVNGGGNLAFGGNTTPTTIVVADAIGMSPGIDSTGTSVGYSCGVASLRWKEVQAWMLYSNNGTVQTSDRRKKKEILPEQYGLAFINQLNPVTYKWLGDKADDPVRHGLIAQEVKTVIDKQSLGFAGWVLSEEGTAQEYQGLNYAEFIAPLIKAVQELSLQNVELYAKIASLELRRK